MNSVKPHIGIVGCSSEGAALCYRTICLEGAKVFGEHGHPDVSMHTHCLGDYMKCVEKDDWIGVGKLMLSSAQKLKSAGAEILLCPDNTVHQSFGYVESQSPLPWLHIAEVVVRETQRQNLHHLGVLGTKFLMEGPVYREACERGSVGFSIPDLPARSNVNRIIFDELVKGIITLESRSFFSKAIDELKKRGCDGVVLGCTEIPLIVRPEDSSLPTLDSTRLLARASLAWAKDRAGS